MGMLIEPGFEQADGLLPFVLEDQLGGLLSKLPHTLAGNDSQAKSEDQNTNQHDFSYFSEVVVLDSIHASIYARGFLCSSSFRLWLASRQREPDNPRGVCSAAGTDGGDSAEESGYFK